jgi:hypothetical protein
MGSLRSSQPHAVVRKESWVDLEGGLGLGQNFRTARFSSRTREYDGRSAVERAPTGRLQLQFQQWGLPENHRVKSFHLAIRQPRRKTGLCRECDRNIASAGLPTAE